jgi:hypothetical protein
MIDYEVHTPRIIEKEEFNPDVELLVRLMRTAMCQYEELTKTKVIAGDMQILMTPKEMWDARDEVGENKGYMVLCQFNNTEPLTAN